MKFTPKPKLSKAYLAGMWVKEMPQAAGTYHVASRDGQSAGFREVYRTLEGDFAQAGPLTWGGWWWSVPVRVPPPPKGPWTE